MQHENIFNMKLALFFLIPIPIEAIPTTVGISIKDTLVANTAERHTQIYKIHIPRLTSVLARCSIHNTSVGRITPAIMPFPCHVLVIAKVSDVYKDIFPNINHTDMKIINNGL
jgi:hypothetical protein